jgi:hypothetical protein
MSCSDLLSYLGRCGVVCPNGDHFPGKAGCTSGSINFSLQPFTPTPAPSSQRGQVCVTAKPKVVFSAVGVATTTIHWEPTPAPCCSKRCEEEIARVEATLSTHEAGHHTILDTLVSGLNTKWAATQRVTGCGATTEAARADLKSKILAAVTADTEAATKTFKSTEPAPAGSYSCALCDPPKQGEICCKDRCMPERDCCRPECGTGQACCNGVCCKPGEVCVDGQCLGDCDNDGDPGDPDETSECTSPRQQSTAASSEDASVPSPPAADQQPAQVASASERSPEVETGDAKPEGSSRETPPARGARS